MKKILSLLSYIILVISTGFAILTLLAWSILPIGWPIITVFIILMAFSVYVSIRNKKQFVLHLLYLIYFSFIFAYFIIWGFSDWGTAFIGLFVRIITPVFIVANVFPVIAQFFVKRIK